VDYRWKSGCLIGQWFIRDMPLGYISLTKRNFNPNVTLIVFLKTIPNYDAKNWTADSVPIQNKRSIRYDGKTYTRPSTWLKAMERHVS